MLSRSRRFSTNIKPPWINTKFRRQIFKIWMRQASVLMLAVANGLLYLLGKNRADLQI
jgi:hypothetical protein